MTPEELTAFIRSITGPRRRQLEGKEYEHISLILKMAEPTGTSNNQHSWCEEYYVSDKYYDVHYFPNEDPIIEEVYKEE
jgi:hypothetical protein